MSWLTALGFGHETENFNDESNICGYKVINDRGEDIGNIKDYVFDGNDRLRYLVVGTGLAGFGKNVTIPAGSAQIDDRRQEVMVSGITKDRLESMPEYNETQGFSEDYEQNWMRSYYPDQQQYTTSEGHLDYDRYDQFRTPERLQLLEERLQINKRPELEGQVTIGKRVQTRQESVDVPVTRERLVIERNPVDETTADAGDMTLRDDEITVPLYKEEVDVTKRAVVAEEVNIRKEQETETRTVTETVGREELDINDPDRLTSSDRGIEAGFRGDETTTERKGKVKVDVIPLDEK